MRDCRQVPTGPGAPPRHHARGRRLKVSPRTPLRRHTMPVILWLLGVPLAIVLLLMLFGVI